MRSTIAGLVAAALLAAPVAVPAQATVRERLAYHDEWSFVEDCGFPVQVTGSGDGRATIREGQNADDGAFPVLDRFSFSETWTNIESGEWFVIRGQSIFNEVEATRIEGSIFEFRVVQAGRPFIVEDADGNVVAAQSRVRPHQIPVRHPRG
jgi:hypothetical protein